MNGGSGGDRFAIRFGGLRANSAPFCTRRSRGLFGGSGGGRFFLRGVGLRSGVAVVAQQLFQHGFARPGGIKGFAARRLLFGGGAVESAPVVGVRAVA